MDVGSWGLRRNQPGRASFAIDLGWSVLRSASPKGKQAYQASCAACHGDNLVSVDPESPSLTGPRFKVAWVGKTIAEPFELTRKTMPPTSPGSLDNQTNVDILAFVLELNGYPTGPKDLGVDLAVLKKIVIERAENRPRRFDPFR